MYATGTVVSSSTFNPIFCSTRKQLLSLPRLRVGVGQMFQNQLIAKRNRNRHTNQKKEHNHRFSVCAATEGSAKSSDAEEKIPSWARPDSDEPPPWARGESKDTSQQSFEIPFFVYLLGSAVIAIAAVSIINFFINLFMTKQCVV